MKERLSPKCSSCARKYSGIPISQTLGFSNLPISRTKPCIPWIFFYNFTPDFSNQTLFPLDLLHSISIISPPDFSKLSITRTNFLSRGTNRPSIIANDAHLDNLRKSIRNISQIVDQSFSNAKRQQVITNYFS